MQVLWGEDGAEGIELPLGQHAMCHRNAVDISRVRRCHASLLPASTCCSPQIYGSCDYGNMKARRPIREGSVLSYLNKVGSSNNPCTTDTDLESYLNTPAVQTALHVKATTYQVGCAVGCWRARGCE